MENLQLLNECIHSLLGEMVIGLVILLAMVFLATYWKDKLLIPKSKNAKIKKYTLINNETKKRFYYSKISWNLAWFIVGTVSFIFGYLIRNLIY